MTPRIHGQEGIEDPKDETCDHQPVDGVTVVHCFECDSRLHDEKRSYWHCLRCGYVWPVKDPTKRPKSCANVKCKSPYWDRPRQQRGGSQ